MEETPASLRSSIQEFLDNSLLAVVSWSSMEGKPGNGLYIFGNDNAGRLYIRIGRESVLAKTVPENPDLSLLVYREEDDLKEIQSVVLAGTGEIVDDPDSETAAHGYEYLRQKSPLIGQTPFLEDRDRYRLLMITVNGIRTCTYGDYLEGRPSSGLKRRASGPS